MKTHLSMYLIITIVLSGCAANPTAIPTPSQIVPTLASVIQQPTLTLTVMVPAVDTATFEVIVPTGTTEPTPTSALVMEIVGDTAQSPVPQPQSCQRPQNYTVQRGDTLSSLAQRTGTSWQQIQAANCLASTTIFTGQRLYLPSVPAPATPVQGVDTLEAPSPGDPRTEVDPGSGAAGSTFVIKIRDFDPFATITIQIEPSSGAPVSTFPVTMNADGDFDVAWASPSNLAAGPYTVRSFRADLSQGKVGTILIIP